MPAAIELWAKWPPQDSPFRKVVAEDALSSVPKNPGLAFDKFSACIALKQLGESQRTARQPKRAQLRDQKAAVLRRIAEIYKDWRQNENALLKELGMRQQAVVDSLARQPRASLCTWQPRLVWRMTSRLGAAHPFEIGFMFHPLFGVPYLPGSGFKGAVRFAYWARFIAESRDAELSESRRLMKLLFGSDEPSLAEPEADFDDDSHRRGLAIFFDVLPPRDAHLELDILNPHFPEWYQRARDETDDQNPVPNFFLTVAGGAAWRFDVLLAPGNLDVCDEDLKACRERLDVSMADCLETWGVGAKTAAGYGLFDLQASRQPTSRRADPTVRASSTTEPAGTEADLSSHNRQPASATERMRAEADPVRAAIEHFGPKAYGSLRQLYKRCAGNPENLAHLALKLQQVYGADKGRMKDISKDYPDLAVLMGKT